MFYNNSQILVYGNCKKKLIIGINFEILIKNKTTKLNTQ